MTRWLLGVDSGGSGLRLALARAGEGTAGGDGDGDGGTAPVPVGTDTVDEPVRTGSTGIDPHHLLELVLPRARRLLAAAAGRNGGTGAVIDTVCVGAAGMATLGGGLRAVLPKAFAAEFGTRCTALAADAVTAYAGALGERPGAVVAAGTGMVAIGTDLRTWRRADGWGQLLGDCGGGAWIGRAGLEAALRAHDGRPGGSAALLARAEAVFGPVTALPGKLYPRTDRPAVLASFAPEVARLAGKDPVAARVMDGAAAEIAMSAAAVCPAAGAAGDSADDTADGGRVALTGGLLRLGEPLLAPLRRELAARLPRARTVPAAGGPLAGALLVAGRLSRGSLRLPTDPELLGVVHTE
ncbi:BadF/BadG/BcrA/BcrD ATPase family protein [Streptomyces sp. TRM 70361]|uniref:N-acetylglucosamine kinase n=1 Tax=Streptomyces sp. TRM 70361 TaxID=3116553 RepID=UPI002E7BB5E4|nr:BadF/BadG/BcrA/BcrD ATPase family protein [Streptomyces sp. TRM 70361]MEE1940745.1 BadF/BadG/BcrA/BcrD ATPase family protein [Streptomyces sp. TRM 70361]